eukprot:jgi/Botrbrau1/5641/Bobra.55_1s0029.1
MNLIHPGRRHCGGLWHACPAVPCHMAIPCPSSHACDLPEIWGIQNSVSVNKLRYANISLNLLECSCSLEDAFITTASLHLHPIGMSREVEIVWVWSANFFLSSRDSPDCGRFPAEM